MSMNTIRASAGLVLALALAAFTWPASSGGDTPAPDQAVHAASAGEPVVIGPVDESAVGDAGAAVQSLGEQIASRAAAAEAERAEAARVEAELAEQVYVASVEAYAAAVEAAQREQLAVAIEAENATRLALAVQAEEAQRAEARRAAAPATSGGSLEAIIQRHFGSAAPAAIRIAQCESSMNPNARSATNDHGLFQINAVHRSQFEAVTGAPWSSVYDPELNTIYARHLYGQQGWSPWTCA